MRSHVVKVIDHLPPPAHRVLRQLQYGLQQRLGTFTTPEPEFALLPELVASGDTVVDVGANVGHYTCRLAQLVGAEGHVVAIEPIPVTFSHLTINANRSASTGRHAGTVTLINAAASDTSDVTWLTVPSNGGRSNYFRASIERGPGATGTLRRRALCVTIDAIVPPTPIRLVKIDVEGHERAALVGMSGLIDRDHPILIVEDNDDETPKFLRSFDYRRFRHPASPNSLYVHGRSQIELPAAWHEVMA